MDKIYWRSTPIKDGRKDSGYSWGIPTREDNVNIDEVIAMYLEREKWFKSRDIGQWKNYVGRMGEKIHAQLEDAKDKIDYYEMFIGFENAILRELEKTDDMIKEIKAGLAENPDNKWEHKLLENYEDTKHDLENRLARIRIPEDRSNNYYLMTHHDKPVSGMIITLSDKEVWGKTKNTAFVKSFVSTEPGSGSELLSEVEWKLAWYGIKNLNLDYWGENEELGKYYEKQGFEHMGTAGEYKAGGTIAKMSKDLTKLRSFRENNTWVAGSAQIPNFYLE